MKYISSSRNPQESVAEYTLRQVLEYVEETERNFFRHRSPRVRAFVKAAYAHLKDSTHGSPSGRSHSLLMARVACGQARALAWELARKS